MNNSIKYIFLFIFLFNACKTNFAQQGNLYGEQVNVVQEYKPTIAEATKINDNPKLTDTIAPAPKMNYLLLKKRIDTNFLPDTIKPAKMKGEPLKALYPGYFKGGLGNYNTPLAEIFLSTLRSKTYQANFHAKHFSSSFDAKNFGRAGFSDNIIEGNGKYFVEEHTLSADLSYYRFANRFYGYNSALFKDYFDTINNRQFYNTFNAAVAVESRFSDTNKLKHQEKFSYRFINDKLQRKENSFSLSTELSKYINNEQYGAEAEWQHYSLEQPIGVDGTNKLNADIIKVSPFVKVRNKGWNATLGINAFYEAQDKLIKFYPNILVNAVIARNIASAYLLATGNTSRNSFIALANQNPFLISPVNSFNTSNRIDVTLGFRGIITKSFSYHISGNYKLIENMALFVNRINFMDSIDRFTAPGNVPHDFRYKVISDGAQIYNLKAEINHNWENKILTGAYFNYYNYIMETQQYAWFRPDYDAGINVSYLMDEKIILKTEIYYIGRQYAKREYESESNFTGIAPNNFSVYKIKGWLDVNLSASYRYNKRLSAFVKLNNLAGTRYQRWLDYPSQSFNFLAGASISF